MKTLYERLMGWAQKQPEKLMWAWWILIHVLIVMLVGQTLFGEDWDNIWPILVGFFV